MRRRWALALSLTLAVMAGLFIQRELGPPAPAVSVTSTTLFGYPAHELILDNGFRIVLLEDQRVPRVAASLWYRFGALQEHYGEHGAAHFLEHAIHQGTTTVGITDPAVDRALWREIYETEQELIAERNAQRNLLRDRNVFFDEGDWPTTPRMDSLRSRLYALEDEQAKHRIFWEEYNWYRRHGGIMRHTDPVPANTGNELMRIEVDLPKERIELFFRLEADRMVNAVLRGWEAQRFTVLEQFFGINRQPTGRFFEALNGVTGIVHPIRLHPGGHLRDHAYWDRASMLRMYDDYIVPNNATLALVGAVSVDEIHRLAAEYFGRVGRGPDPPAHMDVEAEPPPGGSVRLDWHEPLDPRVIVRYRIPGVGHPDRPAFDVMARLLSEPAGSLDAEQTGPRATWQASASRNGSPNRLTIEVRAARDEDVTALERAALAAVERLRRGEVSEAALAWAQRQLRMEWELLRSERGNLASELGAFAVADDWRTMQAFFEQRAATTARDIQRLAERYLVPWNRVIATTRRNPQPEAQGNLTATPALSATASRNTP